MRKADRPHVVVSRVGTLLSYRWEKSAPMSRDAAARLAREVEWNDGAAVVHPAEHVEKFGLPEGWEPGKTDAQCVRERIADLTEQVGCFQDDDHDAADRAYLARLQEEIAALTDHLVELEAQEAA